MVTIPRSRKWEITTVLFEVIKVFKNLIEVVVVQHCECIKCHCTIHFLIFIYFFAHVTWHVGS